MLLCVTQWGVITDIDDWLILPEMFASLPGSKFAYPSPRRSKYRAQSTPSGLSAHGHVSSGADHTAAGQATVRKKTGGFKTKFGNSKS